MIVGFLRWSRTAAALTVAILLASACGSDGDEEPSFSTITILADESGATRTDESTQASLAEDAPATIVDYTPMTVQFDPADPPNEEEVQNILFAAVKADHENGLWCWANTSSCVEDRHLGPAVAGTRFDQLSESLQAYRGENGIYQAGDRDGIFPVEINATLENNFETGPAEGFRQIGQVFACEAYNGVYFVPDAEGGISQILNDAPAGYVTEFSVWQGEDGVLRTASRSFSQEGGIELCDQYRG